MFAIEHSGVQPDLVTVAKSLAGGFPLSGVIGREAVMQAAEPGGLGGTYAGNPIACAAALAVLDVIEEERLMERADGDGRPHQGACAAHFCSATTLFRWVRSADPAQWSGSRSSRSGAAPSRMRR